MQYKFLTAFLLVGACLAQVSLAQSNTDIHQKGLIDYLISQSEEAIDEMTNMTRNELNNAFEIFDEQRNREIRLARKSIASVDQLLNNVTSDAQEQIQEIADRASELEIDISACTAPSEDQLRQLLKEFSNAEFQCAQKEIDIAFEIIDDSIVNATKIFNETQVLPQKLSDCGRELSNVECITGVFWEAKALGTELAMRIGWQVADAEGYISVFNDRLEVCATTQVTGAEIEAAKIVAEVDQCAAEAIGDNIKY